MGHRIAVVEDEDQIRSQIIKDLGLLGLSQISSFANGEEFVRDLQQNQSQYDLV